LLLSCLSSAAYPPLLLSIDGTDRRTPDRYVDDRPFYAGSVNKRPANDVSCFKIKAGTDQKKI